MPVTAADIAKELGVKLPSVRYVLKYLRQRKETESLMVGQTYAYPDLALEQVRAVLAKAGKLG